MWLYLITDENPVFVLWGLWHSYGTAQIRRDLTFAGGYHLGAPRFSPYRLRSQYFLSCNPAQLVNAQNGLFDQVIGTRRTSRDPDDRRPCWEPI
jgi:hypothetical protein